MTNLSCTGCSPGRGQVAGPRGRGRSAAVVLGPFVSLRGRHVTLIWPWPKRYLGQAIPNPWPNCNWKHVRARRSFYQAKNLNSINLSRARPDTSTTIIVFAKNDNLRKKFRDILGNAGYL